MNNQIDRAEAAEREVAKLTILVNQLRNAETILIGAANCAAKEAEYERDRADKAMRALHEAVDQGAGYYQFPRLDLPGVTYQSQTMKVAEEFYEMMLEINRPNPDHERVCAEAFDLIQTVFKIVDLARQAGCDTKAANDQHCEKLRSRGHKIVGVNAVEVGS